MRLAVVAGDEAGDLEVGHRRWILQREGSEVVPGAAVAGLGLVGVGAAAPHLDLERVEFCYIGSGGEIDVFLGELGQRFTCPEGDDGGVLGGERGLLIGLPVEEAGLVGSVGEVGLPGPLHGVVERLIELLHVGEVAHAADALGAIDGEAALAVAAEDVADPVAERAGALGDDVEACLPGLGFRGGEGGEVGIDPGSHRLGGGFGFVVAGEAGDEEIMNVLGGSGDELGDALFPD